MKVSHQSLTFAINIFMYHKHFMINSPTVGVGMITNMYRLVGSVVW